jgi:predicted RNA polymerase sigma factor
MQALGANSGATVMLVVPWLISTARFKAIGGIRRRACFDTAHRDFALYLEARVSEAHGPEDINLSIGAI